MLAEYFDEWSRLGAMPAELANAVFENLDSIMEEGIVQIETLTFQDQTDEAFLVTMKMTSLVNAATARQPKIISKLSKWVGKLKSALQTLGTSSNILADQISISVGVPLGVFVGLAWDI